MATVTGGGVTTFVTAGSNDTNGVALGLTNTINAALANGSLSRTIPTINPSVGGGLATIATAGTYFLAPAVTSIVVADGTPSTIVGSGAANESILVGNSTVAFNTNGGSGTFVSGDAAELIATPSTGGGAFSFTTGAGNDIILALSGTNTINAGGGVNVSFTGAGADLINSQGTDIINGAIGGRAGVTDTVNGGGAGTSTLIAEGPKNLVFNGGAGSTTILSGTGSDTINLGAGGGLVAGGTAGNNRISTGFTGTAIAFGGGSGDVLTANGSGSNTLIAASGNETLTGAGATGNNIFYAGSGSDVITGGAGADTIFAGTGNSTIDGGPGADLIAFTNTRGGGSVTINGFRPGTDGDRVTLQGYSTAELATDLPRAVVTPATGSAVGATTITLSDNTRITFNGVTNLSPTNFV